MTSPLGISDSLGSESIMDCILVLIRFISLWFLRSYRVVRGNTDIFFFLCIEKKYGFRARFLFPRIRATVLFSSVRPIEKGWFLIFSSIS